MYTELSCRAKTSQNVTLCKTFRRLTLQWRAHVDTIDEVDSVISLRNSRMLQLKGPSFLVLASQKPFVLALEK